jgi:hypothetical protein
VAWRGASVLHSAAYGGCTAIISALLRMVTPDVGFPVVAGGGPSQQCGSPQESSAYVEELLRGTVTEGAHTLLHMAALGGSVPAVEQLLAAGADPHAKDANGNLAWHLAAQQVCVGP